jgi:hypothetical protein
MANIRRNAASAATFGILLTLSAAGAAWGAPLLDVSRTTIDFGRDAGGAEFVQPLFLTNVGDAPLSFSGFPITGKDLLDYRVGGTCTVGSVLRPGDRCRLDVIGAPGTSPSSATLTLQSDSAGGPVSVALIATPSFDITRGLYATPPWIDFDHQPVGTTSVPHTITLTNPEHIPHALVLESVAISGKNAADFSMTSDCVVGNRYVDNASCSATITFTPGGPGPRAAEIRFVGHPPTVPPMIGFVPLIYSLTGFGGAVTLLTVVEYYNATLDHYFITWMPAEQANLDAGSTPTKWSRTGYSYRAYATQQTGTSPVCRYYLPPVFGDSHFFGRGSAECDATGMAHPAFVLEDPKFMEMILPTAGTCPAGTTPIYRVFSNRPDANHRYMTDRAVRDAMVAKGWLAEGDGPDLVVMCAP